MPRRPSPRPPSGRAAIVAAAAVAVLGLAACNDDVSRVDTEDEPTILQPNVDEIVTEAP